MVKKNTKRFYAALATSVKKTIERKGETEFYLSFVSKKTVEGWRLGKENYSNHSGFVTFVARNTRGNAKLLQIRFFLTE